MFELRHEYKVVDLIKVARIARSTYYYWIKAFKRPDKYKEVKETIHHIFHKHKGRYGYRRITLELHRLGYLINHKTVCRLMKELGLKCLVRLKSIVLIVGEQEESLQISLNVILKHLNQMKNG